jgi:hypothetical protein
LNREWLDVNEEMALKDTAECRKIKELENFTKMLIEL